MAYVVIFVKDSIQLRETRLAKEAAEAKALAEAKTPELETLNPSADSNFQDKKTTSEEKTQQKQDEEEEASLNCSKKVFNFLVKPLIDGAKTILKERPNNGRSMLILAIIIFVLEYFVIIGKWGTSFLYFRRALKWTIVEYTRYTTILGVVGVFAQYALMPLLTKTLQLRDTTILLVSYISDTATISMLKVVILSGRRWG